MSNLSKNHGLIDETQTQKNPRFSGANASSESIHQEQSLNFGVGRSNVRQQTCIDFSKGKCRNQQCRSAHVTGENNLREPERFNSVCRYFVNRQPCPFGNRCRFLHHEASIRGSNGSQVNRNVGFAKTRMCANWARTRSCSYGDRCKFAHGDEELRAIGNLSSSKNAEAGLKNSKWSDMRKNREVYADWIDIDNDNVEHLRNAGN